MAAATLPKQQKETAVCVVGGAGLLGRYLIRRWADKLEEEAARTGQPKPRLLSVDLRANPGADLSVLADLREPAVLEQNLFAKYAVRDMIVAVKPPLVGPSYQFFMELNVAGVCDLAKLAEKHQVGTFVYVSSLACTDHWASKINCSETDPEANPPLSQLRSPYDLSKRMAEEFILRMHSSTGMRTLSIRIGGIYGDDDDQYWNRRIPFNLSLEVSNVPGAPLMDSNYIENVTEGLLRATCRLSSDASVGGRYYFYTIGDRHATQQELGVLMAAKAGRIHIQVSPAIGPYLFQVLAVLSSLPLQGPSWPFGQPAGRAVEPKPYFTTCSMSRMGFFNMTFDNTLFRKTFGYSHLFTTEEAIDHMNTASARKERDQEKLSVIRHLFGPLCLSVITAMVAAVYINLSLSPECTSLSACSIAQAFVIFASPLTHFLGFATRPAYKLWQPGVGGRTHVCLQASGTKWQVRCKQRSSRFAGRSVDLSRRSCWL
eukprot:TRINITY_DN30906_c0_g1_i2.p1 TRINITY_DN30906_c0_g1~~TRINITY_DN30906_c0_g1_i2.p1  ORF type:complete len:487 (-),score=48.65 TRINITY_DN30906_c0_g1_i2:428-1888(-)